jgi:hypothetical protein
MCPHTVHEVHTIHGKCRALPCTTQAPTSIACTLLWTFQITLESACSVYVTSYMATHTHTHYIISSNNTVYTRHASPITPLHTHFYGNITTCPFHSICNTSTPQASHILHSIYTSYYVYICMYTHVHPMSQTHHTYIPHCTPG